MLQTEAIGYLGQDATVQSTNGKTVINFSIAHSEKWKDQQGVLHEKTTWLNCSMWERPNLAPHLKKGTQVWVSGTPSVSAYASKADGKPMADLRLTVNRLELLGAKKENNQAPATGTHAAPAHEEMPAMEPADDLTF